MSVFSDIIEGWRLILTRRQRGEAEQIATTTQLGVDESDPVDVTVMLERGDSGQFTIESPQLALVGDDAPERVTVTPLWLHTSVHVWQGTHVRSGEWLEDFRDAIDANTTVDDYIPNLARLMGITEDEVRQRLFPERTGNEPMLGGDKRQDGAA